VTILIITTVLKNTKKQSITVKIYFQEELLLRIEIKLTVPTTKLSEFPLYSYKENLESLKWEVLVEITRIE